MKFYLKIKDNYWYKPKPTLEAARTNMQPVEAHAGGVASKRAARLDFARPPKQPGPVRRMAAAAV